MPPPFFQLLQKNQLDLQFLVYHQLPQQQQILHFLKVLLLTVQALKVLLLLFYFLVISSSLLLHFLFYFLNLSNLFQPYFQLQPFLLLLYYFHFCFLLYYLLPYSQHQLYLFIKIQQLAFLVVVHPLYLLLQSLLLQCFFLMRLILDQAQEKHLQLNLEVPLHFNQHPTLNLLVSQESLPVYQFAQLLAYHLVWQHLSFSLLMLELIKQPCPKVFQFHR